VGVGVASSSLRAGQQHQSATDCPAPGTLLLLKSSGLLRDGIMYYEAACGLQFACSAYKSQIAFFLLASRSLPTTYVTSVGPLLF
jgi:hypothetical protein